MDLCAGRPLHKHEIADLLTEARSRTLLLVAPLDDGELRVQHDPLMSPIVWDLGHIAHFEEVWLLENVESGGSGSEGLRGMFDPFDNPRALRDRLPLPDPVACRDYMAGVRRAVFDRLEALDLTNGAPLLEGGYVFRMVLQHEYQHGETVLQTLQLKKGRPYPAPRALAHPGGAATPAGGVGDPEAPGGDPAHGATGSGEDAMVRFDGGEVELGTDDRTEAYDNERPRHRVRLAPFWIDRHPVTSGHWLRFMADGGYQREELWAEAGRAWLRDTGARSPLYWTLRDGRWTERVMDREREVDPNRPVCHVCYWEADAYARWAGKRLPTEAEWETAASWDPVAGRKSRFPWGDEAATPLHANLDALAFDTAPPGSHPRNVSPLGCHGMIGDVWEWTSSDFLPWPGFRAFPYREYSEVFFGDEYKVLRGGSWATRTGAIRNTFRNWDYPIRRQIFSGLRCARDG